MKQDLLLIRTLKNYIYDFSIKNGYINKLGDIFKKYSKIYHTAIKIKPADVKSKRYVNITKENN